MTDDQGEAEVDERTTSQVATSTKQPKKLNGNKRTSDMSPIRAAKRFKVIRKLSDEAGRKSNHSIWSSLGFSCSHLVVRRRQSSVNQ